MRYPVIPALVLCLIISQAQAETYRVGPGEKHSKISEVAEGLVPGDIVEVTGNVMDSVRLAQHGTQEKPITIRGVTRVENGRIVRPRVTGTGLELPGGS